MRIRLEDLPGHEGLVGLRMPDGSLTVAPEAQPDEPADTPRTGRTGAATDEHAPTPTAYRAMCSCGWTGSRDHPPTEEGTWSVTSEWSQHMKPLWAAAAPAWLLNRSDTLRDSVADLTTTWPLQALGVLAEVERWQKPLIERAVVAAREAGASWSEIGTALGITKQSAHERFNAAVRRTSPN